MFRSVWDQIHYAGFLLGIFSGCKIYCYANFFCYAIVFGPNFREGQKFSGGANCLRGHPLPPPPVEESQYGMDTICLHRTGSNLNSIVPYGIWDHLHKWTYFLPESRSNPYWIHLVPCEHKAYQYQFHTVSKGI